MPAQSPALLCLEMEKPHGREC